MHATCRVRIIMFMKFITRMLIEANFFQEKIFDGLTAFGAVVNKIGELTASSEFIADNSKKLKKEIEFFKIIN